MDTQALAFPLDANTTPSLRLTSALRRLAWPELTAATRSLMGGMFDKMIGIARASHHQREPV